MRSKFLLFLAALLISASPSSGSSQTDQSTLTLQVASFPDSDLADRFIAQLVIAGEHPLSSTVDLEERGHWTRVFVGSFSSAASARRYGDMLVKRGIVNEYLVKKAEQDQSPTRPRRVRRNDTSLTGRTTRTAVTPPPIPTGLPADLRMTAMVNEAGTATGRRAINGPLSIRRAAAEGPSIDTSTLRLPILNVTAAEHATRVETSLIPRPDPVRLAIRFVVGESRLPQAAPHLRSGLWITGDTSEALARLRWIVGEENVALIKTDVDGRVMLDHELLGRASGLEAGRLEDPLQVADYVTSNEGLLLLVQLTEGRHRYRLHLGRSARTSGKIIELTGSINLDNNFDSRINPYRKQGRKLDNERPPEGFDSLVGLNPIARWFNINTNSMVPVGEITFHELAEAYGKVELGLDYLEQGPRPGAHALALVRERRLQQQRPGAFIVLTAGSNRVLRSEEEIRLFYAEAPSGVSQR